MAPEVILGSGHTTDADLWSTGVMACPEDFGGLPRGCELLHSLGERANFTGLVLGCTEAKSCK